MVKVILVTGASRGIGESIVEVLLNLSADAVVYGVARSEAPLVELKKKYGNRFFYVVGDITDDQVLKSLVDEAVRGHGKIDSLIANAGVLEPVQNVNDIVVSDWKKLYDVNFFSIVSLVSIALPFLKQSNGSILFVSSDASDTYFNCWGAYGSSKAALNHFAMTIANEEKSVKALAIAPGIVDTQMQVEIRENVGPKAMSEEALSLFKGLKSDNRLLDSSVPATVYAKLALNGIPEAVNGKYLSYDAESLKEFR
ncbi:hypothetical protein HG537_0D06510 [Torulaspora globosa]|uniref:NAD(P)-binding protein n=1 Tax=Torulaspora globosa TaxID=48254 RepID=A0A7H9HTG7_9SACH|nr:hypothetical protein HG537_0D06510 [Torulaspora sp. CBS 2947]